MASPGAQPFAASSPYERPRVPYARRPPFYTYIGTLYTHTRYTHTYG